MTTTVTMDLIGVNAAQPNTSNMVMLVAAVNPDGSYIGSGGGGGGGGNVNLSQVGGTAYSLGQKAMAASLPVVLASDSAALPVSGTVSLTGVTVGRKAMAASLPVTLASDQPTIPVSLTGNQATNVAQVGGAAIALGATTASASLPVVLATDTANLPANIAQFGGAAVSLGQKANAASLPATLSTEQIAAMSAFNFTAGSTQAINATTTSANTVLGAAASGALQIANTGTVVAFVALGTSAQTASTTSYPVLPGATVVISGGGATNIAAMTPSGTATLYISRGTGL